MGQADLMSYNDSVIQEIRRIASGEKWIEIDHQEKIKMLSFSNAIDRINVYYSRMTVATCIRHPKQGDTQLFRKHCTFDELQEIFKNPRVHSGKGYQRIRNKKYEY